MRFSHGSLLPPAGKNSPPLGSTSDKGLKLRHRRRGGGRKQRVSKGGGATKAAASGRSVYRIRIDFFTLLCGPGPEV